MPAALSVALTQSARLSFDNGKTITGNQAWAGTVYITVCLAAINAFTYATQPQTARLGDVYWDVHL